MLWTKSAILNTICPGGRDTKIEEANPALQSVCSCLNLAWQCIWCWVKVFMGQIPLERGSSGITMLECRVVVEDTQSWRVAVCYFIMYQLLQTMHWLLRCKAVMSGFLLVTENWKMGIGLVRGSGGYTKIYFKKVWVKFVKWKSLAWLLKYICPFMNKCFQLFKLKQWELRLFWSTTCMLLCPRP